MTPTIQDVLDNHNIHPNRSKNIECPSPNHEDNDPSCRVNEDYVYCFSCAYNADAAGLEATLSNRPIEDVLKAWSTDDPNWRKTTTPKSRLNKHQMIMQIYGYWVQVSQDWVRKVFAHLPEWYHEAAKEQIFDVFDAVTEVRRTVSPAVFSDVVRDAVEATEQWAKRWLEVDTSGE